VEEIEKLMGGRGEGDTQVLQGDVKRKGYANYRYLKGFKVMEDTCWSHGEVARAIQGW
jgi:hypothetical protein